MKLFKYYKINEFLFKVLKDKQPYFASVSDLNDISDSVIIQPDAAVIRRVLKKKFPQYKSSIHDKNPKFQQVKSELIQSYSQSAKKINQNIKENVLIFCASLDEDSKYLWENYADSSKGVMVTFDLKTQTNLRAPVAYVESKSEIVFEEVLNQGKSHWDIAQKILFTKELAWQHEKEFRIVLHSSFDTEIPNDISLMGVKFGKYISKQNKQDINSICKVGGIPTA